MRTAVLTLVIATLTTAGMAASDPPGFKHWTAAELKARDAELPKHLAPDHSSRETLADYSDHGFACSTATPMATPNSTMPSSTSSTSRVAKACS